MHSSKLKVIYKKGIVLNRRKQEPAKPIKKIGKSFIILNMAITEILIVSFFISLNIE